jgi:AraC family transcriptional regulator
MGQVMSRECKRLDADGTAQSVQIISERRMAMPDGIVFGHVTFAPCSLPEAYQTWHGVGLHRSATKVTAVLPGGKRRASSSPGSLAFTPAYLPNSISWNEPFEVVVLGFSPEFIADLTSASGRTDDFRVDRGFEDPLLKHLLLALDGEMAEQNPLGRLAVETLTAAVVTQLLRTHAGTRPKAVRTTSGLSPHRSRRLREYIEANLHRPLSLRELAAMVDMNVFHLLRMFKATLGRAPYHYVLERRIERAKELLRDPEFSISEVAFHCGYAEPSSFTRAFHRMTGLSPRLYRRSVEQ